MNSFTDLEAWKKGMDLSKSVYALTDTFPSAEKFGLTSQLRRASASVLANLAEGFSRSTSADKAHKYVIARGESAEVHALLLLAVELTFVTQKDADIPINLALETGKLMNGLVKKFS